MTDGLGEQLARGEPAAWAELYDACADRIHHYLVLRMGSREDADDALQETFVRLAHMRSQLAKVENLTAFVFTMARNEAARLVERRGRPLAVLPAEAIFDVVSSDDPHAGETAEMVAVALERLNPDLRETVELKTYAGLTFREISEVTGVPQGTIATRYRTALGMLREWFARQRL